MIPIMDASFRGICTNCLDRLKTLEEELKEEKKNFTKEAKKHE